MSRDVPCAPPPLVAATAGQSRYTVLQDHRVAAMTWQPCEWIVPSGTADA